MTDLSRVHLVGIGGSGMSGVARILLDRGAVVTGSDVKDSQPVRVLRQAGARIAVGHSADNLRLAGDLPTAVVTSFAAIPQDNPELVAAKERGIPLLRRSDLLAELMDNHRQILFAGTHGKTSSTSMAVTALQAAGMDPSFAIGGQLNKAGTNAHDGTGDVFVAEADESDASLLRYSPTVAVVTTIEPDHLDFFGSADKYFQVFDDFVERILPGGYLVVCLEDDHARALGERSRQLRDDVTVLVYTSRDYDGPLTVGARIVDEVPTTFGTDLTVALEGVLGGSTVQYHLNVPGHHMALNSVAALVAGHVIDADAAKLAEGLNSFTGVRRRFEFKGEVHGARVYDDYAHHPTEIKAVLSAARAKVEAEGKGARVIACFQPHLYSRTIEFAEEFAAALSLADAAVVLDIFGAREQPVEGITGRIITSKMDPSMCRFEPDFSAAPKVVAGLAQPGDLILTIGAGTVTMLGEEILSVLETA